MDKIPTHNLSNAIYDFYRARDRAFLTEIMGRITGESTQLLSYDEVRHRLKAFGTSQVGLKDIPLSAIVGSVGRYNDFTRDFLPKKNSIANRWASIKSATSGLIGLPPIEVYQIGEVYFVKDGNHRVSVARSIGASHISAFVTEVHSRIPISPDISMDDLIVKEEYIKFLEKTRLDILIPDVDLNVTIPGQYPLIEEHISVHQYFMGIEHQHEIPYDEAVVHWYNTHYLPIIDEIRKSGVLRHFPGRTATDMYVFLAEHRAAIEKELGWQISTPSAINDFLKQFKSSGKNIFLTLWYRTVDIIKNSIISPGPPPGEWRKETAESHPKSRLITEILIPVSGTTEGWYAFDQAVIVAHKESALVHGIHIVENEAMIEDESCQSIKEEFLRRCDETGIKGTLSFAAGNVAQLISDRARFTDLVITSLAYPPGPQPLDRVESGFRDLIQHCPRPVLAVPHVSSMNNALLAYDGSAKANEALFLAAYLAEKWNISLNVLTVIETSHGSTKVLSQAENYLKKYKINTKYIIKSGSVAECVMQTANENQCDFFIMGGYGNNPVLEVVLGSAVDQVLREADKPILICR